MSVGDKIPSLGQWCNQNDTYEIAKPRQTSPNHCEDTKTNEGRCDFFRNEAHSRLLKSTYITLYVYLYIVDWLSLLQNHQDDCLY